MKKYALIKDGSARRYITAETMPTIAANKGTWYEVNEDEQPTYDSETQVLERSERLYYGKWKIEYTVRDKTPLELWAHPDYAKKINIPLLSIPTYAGLAVMLFAQGLPTVQKSDGTVDVYLNYIMPEHLAILSNDENITITDKPDE